MNNERRDLLSLRNLPARLEVEEAGWYLGFAPPAIPILIRAGLLKPLGHPARNGPKYFAFQSSGQAVEFERVNTGWVR